MTNRPKAIGTAGETAVVRYVQTAGFPDAERLALKGNLDEGDLAFCRGVIGEVKAGKAAETASDAQVAAWLIETEIERRNRGADVGVLILKRKAVGAANAGRWFAYLPGWAFVYLSSGGAHFAYTRPAHLPAVRITLAETCQLLRRAGYGERIEQS